MINNFILSIVIYVFYFANVAFSESFFLESKNIEILNEGSQINAYNGKAISNDNNLEIKDYEISNLKQNEIFTEGIVKRIFLTKDGDVDLVTNSTLTKNFLILGIKTKYKKIEKNSTEFEKYEAKARLNLINKIYKTFDENLNEKYKVELNKRTIDRVKNSF